MKKKKTKMKEVPNNGGGGGSDPSWLETSFGARRLVSVFYESVYSAECLNFLRSVWVGGRTSISPSMPVSVRKSEFNAHPWFYTDFLLLLLRFFFCFLFCFCLFRLDEDLVIALTAQEQRERGYTVLFAIIWFDQRQRLSCKVQST